MSSSDQATWTGLRSYCPEAGVECHPDADRRSVPVEMAVASAQSTTRPRRPGETAEPGWRAHQFVTKRGCSQLTAVRDENTMRREPLDSRCDRDWHRLWRGGDRLPAGRGRLQDLRARARAALRPEDFPEYPTEDLFVPKPPPTKRGPPARFFALAVEPATAASTTFAISATRFPSRRPATAAARSSTRTCTCGLRRRCSTTVAGGIRSQPDRKRELTPYFDLAAYMLARNADSRSGSPRPCSCSGPPELAPDAKGTNWFRTPLAVSFDGCGWIADPNDVRARAAPCDMRGRCWSRCDRQAKNTLDLNYLARAEDGPTHPPTSARWPR